MNINFFITLVISLLFLASVTHSEEKEQQSTLPEHTIASLCIEMGKKLDSINVDDCLQQNLLDSGKKTTQGRALAYKVYPPLRAKKPLGRVLLMGGIHGDEYSTYSILFKWMNKLNRHHSGLFHWTVVPALNPDGLLKDKSQRQNANGVDLNRNFPSRDWNQLAHEYWLNRTQKNPRRYPGPSAKSEPETQWFVDVIENFKPDVIIAVHAPYGLVDFDGGVSAPEHLGRLKLHLLGTYPGSLGRYAAKDSNIPVLTVELDSAGTMPSAAETSRIWVDIVRWLRKEVPNARKLKPV